jgi:hypothetical protein
MKAKSRDVKDDLTISPAGEKYRTIRRRGKLVGWLIKRFWGHEVQIVTHDGDYKMFSINVSSDQDDALERIKEELFK